MNTRNYQVVSVGWVQSPLTSRAQAPRQGDEGAPDDVKPVLDKATER